MITTKENNQDSAKLLSNQNRECKNYIL